jgi:hypothetical protein
MGGWYYEVSPAMRGAGVAMHGVTDALQTVVDTM